MNIFNLQLSRKKQKYLIIILVLLGAVFAFWKFGIAGPSNTEVIPADFHSARERGAILSSSIVEIYDDAVKSLEVISEKDRNGKYEEALNLTLEGVEPNKKARELSQDLALEIQKMAYAVLSFKTEDARRLVLEGVAAEANLITHLVSYNEHFNDLLGNLSSKFSDADSVDRVNEIISSLNKEAKIINRLDKQFNNAMSEFDSKYK